MRKFILFFNIEFQQKNMKYIIYFIYIDQKLQFMKLFIYNVIYLLIIFDMLLI